MSEQSTKKLINDPDRLIEELIEGMISAHPDLLTTEGESGRAIVALNGPREGKVGIVVGGGSGHGFKNGPAVGKRVAAHILDKDLAIEPRFSFASKGTVAGRTVF